MEPHLLPTEDLTGIYRYAVLLTGAPEAAQAAVLETVADAGEKLHHFRSGKSCKAWLIAKLRSRLMKSPPGPVAASATAGAESPARAVVELSPAALALADRFSRIPEPGRSALALLYLNQFPPQEISQILQLQLDELADAVDSARTLLRQMAAVQEAALPVEPEQAQPAEGEKE